jgi:hypothetical protein
MDRRSPRPEDGTGRESQFLIGHLSRSTSDGYLNSSAGTRTANGPPPPAILQASIHDGPAPEPRRS